MQTAVLIDPEFDDATFYSHLWASRLKEAAEAEGWKIIEIGGRRVSRAEVENALAANPGAPYIHYDHGSEDAHWGSETEPVLDLKNVDKVADRVVYCMNCLSAAKLGAVAYTSYGCIYVGYIREFAFTVEDEKLFCEAANSGFINYAKGRQDWDKIKAIMVEAFNKAIAETDNPWSRTWLTWDRDALRVYAEGADTPESRCVFRKLAIKLFGPKVGWKLTKAFPISVALFAFGLGVLIHDYADALYHAGGWREVLSPQGGYIGATILVIGFILAYYQLAVALGGEGS
jgi:hypothetical protein